MDSQEYASPYHPVNLLNLFLFPKKFFTSDFSLKGGNGAYLAIFLYGIARAVGRIEKDFFQSDVGAVASSDNVVDSLVSGSWLSFWVFALLAGVISGAILWWVGGWWFRVRLRWSGDPDPDLSRARAVYAFSSLVFALPLIGYTFVQTLAYRNPSQAYYAEDWFNWISILLLIFPFWTLFTAFTGVRSQFEVSTRKALFWFVGLQGGIYIAGYLLLFIAALLF